MVWCFHLLRLFDFKERIAGLASITWLLGTTVLHYAQIPHQNNQVLLFVIIGYATALDSVVRQHPRSAIWSGLALGAAVLIRMTSMIHVITVLLFLAGCLAYHSRDLLKVLKSIRLWGVGFLPLALLGRFFDYVRYGSFLTHGQSMWMNQLTAKTPLSTDPQLGLPTELLKSNSHLGFLGVFFSPAKSIFIYDPLLIPCLILGVVLWKRLSPYLQWYLVSGIFTFIFHLVLTSRLSFWHGDWSWGARYHITSIHLLLIPLVALFIQSLRSAKGLSVWLMRSLLAIAFIVQIISVTMPFHLEAAQGRLVPRESRYFQFRLGQRLTNIACQINDSFSEQCINKLSPEQKKLVAHYNHIYFLPFTFSRKVAGDPALAKFSQVLFMVWGLVVIFAVGVTVWFGYSYIKL